MCACLRNTYSVFVTELLGDLGCGVKAQIFSNNGPNEFYEKSKLLVGSGDVKLSDVMRFLFILLCPDLSYFLKTKLFTDEDLDYFVKFIAKRIEMRQNGFRRNDFIDLLMDSVKENGIEEVDKFVICNSFVLFFVGSDTTSGALALICNYLAVHPNVQERLYDEVNEVTELDYNTLTGFKYMTNVIMEATRLMNLNFFSRKCTKKYSIPELNLTIPVGTEINVTCGKLMQETELYPDNPEQFDPDRHGENASMTSSNFLPFGMGPRSCIGMRLANIMIRTALAHFVLNFRVEPTENTDRNWTFEPTNPGGIAKNELVYKIITR